MLPIRYSLGAAQAKLIGVASAIDGLRVIAWRLHPLHAAPTAITAICSQSSIWTVRYALLVARASGVSDFAVPPRPDGGLAVDHNEGNRFLPLDGRPRLQGWWRASVGHRELTHEVSRLAVVAVFGTQSAHGTATRSTWPPHRTAAATGFRRDT